MVAFLFLTCFLHIDHPREIHVTFPSWIPRRRRRQRTWRTQKPRRLKPCLEGPGPRPRAPGPGVENSGTTHRFWIFCLGKPNCLGWPPRFWVVMGLFENIRGKKTNPKMPWAFPHFWTNPSHIGFFSSKLEYEYLGCSPMTCSELGGSSTTAVKKTFKYRRNM